MQLMPDTADWVGEAMLGRAVDPHDLRSNVTAGVRLLRHYLDRYDGDRARVLAAYYQGQAAVDRHGIYSASRIDHDGVGVDLVTVEPMAGAPGRWRLRRHPLLGGA